MDEDLVVIVVFKFGLMWAPSRTPLKICRERISVHDSGYYKPKKVNIYFLSYLYLANASKTEVILGCTVPIHCEMTILLVTHSIVGVILRLCERFGIIFWRNLNHLLACILARSRKMWNVEFFSLVEEIWVRLPSRNFVFLFVCEILARSTGMKSNKRNQNGGT